MTDNNPSPTPTPEEAAAIVREHLGHTGDHADSSNHGFSNHESGIHMPSPSIWPIVVAFGITMISFGVLTGWIFGIFGGVVLTIGLWKWAGEMRRDAA